jgi:signal peptidase II
VQERRPVAALKRLKPPTPARNRYLVIAAVALLVVVLDQLTKTWAEHTLADHDIHLIWTLRLSLTYNPGIAFGLGRGSTPLLVVFAVIVFVILLAFSRSVLNPVRVVAMGMVLGGAMGNLFDRFFRSNGGAVIDFVDLQWWPVFNLADSCLFCGAILLILTASKQ